MKNIFKKMLFLICCTVLIAAMALTYAGCENSEEASTPEESRVYTVKGEGETVFYFIAVGLDKKEACFEIRTNKETVGEALEELGLIEGEEGPYGIYVKTVNGETHDYNEDGKYWAFYINGTSAISGADSTKIT